MVGTDGEDGCGGEDGGGGGGFWEVRGESGEMVERESA